MRHMNCQTWQLFIGYRRIAKSYGIGGARIGIPFVVEFLMASAIIGSASKMQFRVISVSASF